MTEAKRNQLCIACSRLNSSDKILCECGHVLKDGLSINQRNTRMRRPPHRPNAVSSEYIGKSFNQIFKEQAKQKTYLIKVNQIREKQSSKRRTKENFKRDNEKSNKKKTFRNIYFNRCKSYRKFKGTDFDFEFDFSKFETNTPNYPSALEDINTKINRTNTFRYIIDGNGSLPI